MFKDILGKIMFSTERNYLKLVRGVRILHLDSRKSIPQKPKLKTLPSKKITQSYMYFTYLIILNYSH